MVPADHVGVPAAAPTAGGLGFFDIAFNMWALFAVGPSLEQLLGRGRFLTVYLLSALGGAVAFFLIAPPTVGALGASGAIFGLFGAWFVVSRRLRIDTRGILVLIGINLAFSFFFRGNDRLAGSRRRADRGRADHGRLRLRAAQQPDGHPDRGGVAISPSWSCW